jgi:hypothetical protein
MVRPSSRPKVTAADGPHFKALKRAIQETWQLPEYNHVRRGYASRGNCVSAHLTPSLSLLLGLILPSPWEPALPPRTSPQTPPAVMPFLTTGGTDSKHYAFLSRNGILRFVPYMMNKTAGDIGRVHGTNERVERAHFLRAICTYARIMQLMAGPPSGS